MPVSTSTVATPIVPWPHIGRQPLTSMIDDSPVGVVATRGWRIAPDIAPWPRGSCIRSVRIQSRSRSKRSLRSSIVSPGSTPTPPVITRVGIPSV